MSAYRIIQGVFSVVLLFFFIFWLFWDWPLWYFGLTLLLYILVIAYGSYNIRLNFFTKAFHSGPSTVPKIALTFDDGPSPEYTPQVLDLLKSYRAKATFFCIGRHIEHNPELLSRIHNEGHIIGNHSFSHHPLFDLYSKKKVISELQKTNDLIFNITGKLVKIFRPPFGVTNPPIAGAVKKLELKVVGWTIRSYDTMNRPADRIIGKVTRHLENGSVVLLHDNRRDTPKILEGILHYAQENRLKCVDICELFEWKDDE